MKQPHLMVGLKQLVIEASEYVENGDPWKDAIDDSEVAELICYVARCIEADEFNKGSVDE